MPEIWQKFSELHSKESFDDSREGDIVVPSMDASLMVICGSDIATCTEVNILGRNVCRARKNKYTS